MKEEIKKEFNNYHKFLLIIFACVWIWSAINPSSINDWLLENILIFIFVPFILITARHFKLSNLSYTLITLFLIAHVVGSHYTYPEVPFGFFLQDLFGSSRNMYDRFVHFSFGLLMAYPIREIFIRITQVRGIWGYYLPLDVTLSFSALYEIIEWGTVILVNPGDGIAFLGAQGDMWDAQKDMASAGGGAVITMFITGLFHYIYNKRHFITDFKRSLTARRGDKPLGEIAIKRILRINN